MPAAARRRAAAGREGTGRPLREADEKGIDGQLAIDALLMGVANAYDVAILPTTDNDLVPVVERLLALRASHGRPAVEVISWHGVARRLSVPGVAVRWIGRKDDEAGAGARTVRH